MKSLRVNKHWSQEQLAQFSGLNVRTIQRVEKGESVGIESLKSIAAVFEMTTHDLILAIENEKKLAQPSSLQGNDEQVLKAEALKRARAIKYFYFFSAFLIGVFVLTILPNYNGGENLGPVLVSFLSFAVMIAILAFYVFEPFGQKWEQEKAVKILRQQNDTEDARSEN